MFRQRVMSDETVKYLYSKSGGCLHDKSCPVARDIPDGELYCSKDYLPNIPQCPICAAKAYVRLGAKDFYNYSLYEKLFQRMQFTPALLRRMYVDEKMQTKASVNGLTIWGKEDTWRLEFRDGSDTMRLMHNNYHPLSDGTRIFTRGYHRQVRKATAYYALTVISGYTYAGHKEAMIRREKAAQEPVYQGPISPKKSPARKITVAGIWEKAVWVWEKVADWVRKVIRK